MTENGNKAMCNQYVCLYCNEVGNKLAELAPLIDISAKINKNCKHE